MSSHFSNHYSSSSQYFDSIQTKFYIIGATARDMIMDALGEKSGRTTRDLDIAIAIPDLASISSKRFINSK